MAKHERNPLEVSSAAVIHAQWMSRGRVVAPARGLVPGALDALVLLPLSL
jgi:hypothetical protein